MKNKMPLLFSLMLAGLVVESAAADHSVSKIIDRYKHARGGGAVKHVLSTTMSGAIVAPAGVPGLFRLRSAEPEKLRIDIESAGKKVTECYNGKSAWRLDERGLRTLLGDEAKRLHFEALLANSRLGDLQRNHVIAQAAGKATIDGRETNAVDFVKESAHIKVFFDAATNLPVKQEWQTAAGTEEIFFKDYRAVDGVKEPFSIRFKNAQGEMLAAIDHVEHNGPADANAFLYPHAEGERPLPDLEVLLKAVIDNQRKVEDLREHYTFRQVETEAEDDKNAPAKDGKTKETKTKVYEVTPVAGRFVRRLISVNGKELDSSEREKEDHRVQKQVESLIKKREHKAQKQQEARERGEEPGEEKKELTILDFLRMLEVTSVRREAYRGHEVIAFDFEPRKGFKPKGRNETFISKLAGTMWVDEDARQIPRLEARLMSSFKVGGGALASISPSSGVVFEQEKIGDEIWLPSYTEVNVSARLFLLSKLNRNIVMRNSEYKKYQIDSNYELGKPADKKTDERP